MFYKNRIPIRDAHPCAFCKTMIEEGLEQEHYKYCKVKLTETTQCPDCKMILLKHSSENHPRYCKVRIAREKAERKAARLAKAKEKRELGLISHVKMLKEKEDMTFMEPTLEGDYIEVVANKNPWKCKICGLVWQTEHEARNCPYTVRDYESVKKPHDDHYFRLYGVRYVENGVPRGNYLHEVKFQAMRKEEPEVLPEGKKWDLVADGDSWRGQKVEESLDSKLRKAEFEQLREYADSMERGE